EQGPSKSPPAVLVELVRVGVRVPAGHLWHGGPRQSGQVYWKRLVGGELSDKGHLVLLSAVSGTA
ncbi:MAG: hypothetical protein M0R06_20190, partial [Sphaerochaeta sp.]|nr:hypothetical protein [Sphaerochaeta sp.]